MITSICLENFKGFKKTNKLKLKPLTILCGTNSSGKSTIIQSILMLKQTFESSSRYKTILLNGRLTHLGLFEDLVYMRDSKNLVDITVEFNVSHKKVKYRDGRLLGFVYSNILYGDDDEYLEDTENNLEISFQLKNPESNEKGPSVEQFKVNARSFSPSSFNTKDKFIQGTEILFERKENQKYYVKWKDAAPYMYEASDVKIPKDTTKYYCPLCNSNHRTKSTIGKDHYRYYHYVNIAKGSETYLEASFVNLIPSIEGNNVNEFETNFPIANMISRSILSAKNAIQESFSNLFYIGPLREEPSRRYISETEYLEIGNRGEFAPFILATEGEKKVSPYYFLDKETGKWECKSGDTLRVAVNRWLNLMGISEGCNLKSDKEIIRLYLSTIADKNIKVTLADVGFGVSQILPILVEGLRIKPGQTLILEQPEIHLHPKLQMQLADFFISMILSGKNVLLETHSDHIINRIARRVIEDENDRIVSKSNILFFEQGYEGSTIKEIEIDPLRGVINWPKGFFDQSTDEKSIIIEESIKKRRKLVQG